MPQSESPAPAQAVEAAITRVLDAERDAHRAIEDARVTATRILDAARLAARAVAERGDRRIRDLGAALARKVQSEIAALDAEIAALDAEPLAGAAALERERSAVRSLAAEIAGGPLD